MQTLSRSSPLVTFAAAVALTLLASGALSEAAVINGTDYALFGKVNIKMEAGPINITGNIAVNDATGFILVGSHNTVDGTATANRITFGSFAQITTCQFDASTGPTSVCGTIQTAPSLPIVAWPPLGPVTVDTCVGTAPNRTVAIGGTLDLPPGCYGEVRVRDGATLNLATGTYNIRRIVIELGATVNGAGSTSTIVNVRGQVVSEPRITISGVTFNSAASTGQAISIGVNANVLDALFYAPGAVIHLRSGGLYTSAEAVAESVVVEPVTMLPPLPGQETCIRVTKSCEDAVKSGDPIEFSGVVQNCGTEELKDVTVTDDAGTSDTSDDQVVLGPITLGPGETMPYSGSYEPKSSPSTDTVTAEGTGVTTGTPVMDQASATCTAPAPPPPPGSQGCTIGYWQQRHHFASWQPTGHAPGDLAVSLFSELANSCTSLGTRTLVQSLTGGGGREFCDKVRLLIKQAVAAVLNAAHPDVNYPQTVNEIVNAVNAAIASGDASQVLTLKDTLDDHNKLGCPLN